MILFPNTAVEQGLHVGAVGCCTFCSGLIDTFVFNILQIAVARIQFCSGGSAPTCASLATGPFKSYSLSVWHAAKQYINFVAVQSPEILKL
jgi:hypothetical protein